MAAADIRDAIAEKVLGIAPGGVGALHLPASRVVLVRDVRLLRRHPPCDEGDHVLNVAENVLAGGDRLEHIEARRDDEGFPDFLGARHIPDATASGDL
jgi:hypothetical protein